jgi:hypothetical protein
VTFTAPASDGGAAITTYTVTSSTGGITATGPSSPITITGLVNGTAYTFTVTATNSVGTGAASVASNSVTPVVPPPSVTSLTGRVWMETNLGATRVPTKSNDVNGYGAYYQWGRRTDGHQLVNSAKSTTLVTSATVTGTAFVTTNTGDWLKTPNNNLWQGVDGVNNPCPSGYRIPTIVEWSAELNTWISKDPAAAFASPLKLPAAGTRKGTDGTLSERGVILYYWSQTVGTNTNTARILFGGLNAITASGGGSSRSNGFSVRCIQD